MSLCVFGVMLYRWSVSSVRLAVCLSVGFSAQRSVPFVFISPVCFRSAPPMGGLRPACGALFVVIVVIVFSVLVGGDAWPLGLMASGLHH